jgi:limonene-1,2-epoxide hydrolase
MSDANRAFVRRFWDDLYAHRFDRLEAYFTDDCVYDDVPIPAAKVVGGKAIRWKLEVGLGKVPSHREDVHRVVADEATVVTEHTEHWCFDEGVVSLPFVSVQEIRDGKISRWSDYHNIDTLLSAAPAWWMEHVTSEWTKV